MVKIKIKIKKTQKNVEISFYLKSLKCFLRMPVKLCIHIKAYHAFIIRIKKM